MSKRYYEMFGGKLFDAILDKNELKEKVKWAKETLPNSDWITWYLRLYKYEVISNHVQNSKYRFYKDKFDVDVTSINDSKERAFLVKMDSKGCNLDDHSIYSVESSLQHMVDLNLHHINNMTLDWLSPSKVFEQAEDFELSWQAKNEGKYLAEYGEKIVEFKDGSAWFDLLKGGCSQEASAMGHCGNGAGSKNERVLSFRRPAENAPDDGESYWTPYLTFILNTETGELGEMKGRANSKPAMRYHPYIVDLLLKEDRIKKVVGGGYKAENNFHLSDLESHVYDKLMDEKPSLFDFFTLYDKYGDVEFIGDYNFGQAIADDLSVNGEREIDGKQYFVLKQEQDLEDLASSLNLGELENYREIIEEGHADHWDFLGDWKEGYSDNSLEDILDQLQSNNPDEYKKLIAIIEHYHSEEINENDWDMSSNEDISNLIQELNSMETEIEDLYHAISRAYADGERQGAMNELEENFQSLIKDFFKTGDLILAPSESESDSYSYDICFDKEAFFDYVKEDRGQFEYDTVDRGLSSLDSMEEAFDNDHFEANDLSVPYYGFNGFDEEYYVERALDQIKEFISENESAVRVEMPFGKETDASATSRFIEKAHSNEHSSFGM